ncbi:hypothetical protein [Asticcacaulis sp. 201]|uniref:hypothetical protein n=1 Tax=Asticcacaulis sp. 201 TaxID=3028787 RepID=UPI00291707F1|nr:hypothetical protein [Asticcacaulis sp. 201]MDV6329944.1 hypothetical protein [Asticcacaulis sp. 201]
MVNPTCTLTASSENKGSFRMASASLKMPAIFCLHENYGETVAMLAKIREMNEKAYKATRKGRLKLRPSKIKWIDMSTTERIGPSAALALASEFHRLHYLGQTSSTAIDIHRWKPEVIESLRQIGLLDILKITSKSKKPLVNVGTTAILPLRSAKSVIGAEADELNGEIAGIVSQIDFSDELRSEVYDVLVEAMDNVATHAYPDNAVWAFTHAKAWWMTAAVNADERKLTVVIYDQGVSIPVRLPTWQNYYLADRLLQRLVSRFFGTRYEVSDRTKDGLVIRTAMKVAVTSTGKSYHGKGLPRMKAFIEKCRGGSLRILSRSGEYRFHKKDKVKSDKDLSHDVELGGTLIEWEVSY